MGHINRLALLSALLLGVGCGTSLVVKECSREVKGTDGKFPSDKPESATNVVRKGSDGVVVNQRAVYKCKVTLVLPDSQPVTKSVDNITGIDHQTVLALNISRMIFA